MWIPAILLPVFVQVALVFGLLTWMAVARGRDLKSRAVRIGDIAIDNSRWGQRAVLISKCYDNQFAIPTLFYALVAFALITRKADYLFIVMEWLFVLSRLAHAYVHTGTNHVPTRGRAFLIGVVVLLLMWIIFAVRILIAPAAL